MMRYPYRSQGALFLAALLLLGCDAADSGPGNLETSDATRLEELAGLYLEGNPQQAVEGLKQYVAQYPEDDLAYTILGNAYVDLDEIDKAKEAYQTALRHDPTQFRAVTGLGILHRQEGEYDEAMKAYQRAIELEPEYAQAYSSMAVIAILMHDDQQAVDYGVKAYQLDKSDAVISANLALAYHYVGNTDKRDEYAKIARELGYGSMDRLEKIFSGQLSLREEKPESGQ